MGSSLSIVNNTQDEWHCKISADKTGLELFKVILGAIAAAAATIGAMDPNAVGGAAVAADLSKGAKIVSQVVVSANIATDFAANIVKGVDEHLASKNYAKIQAGKKHTWGPLTLSLWQQGTCIRSYAVDNSTVRTETLYMRPIFSGSTANSNRDHDIAYWINKNGVETSDLVNTNKTADGSAADEGNAPVHSE